jgi:hypothetical protein
VVAGFPTRAITAQALAAELKSRGVEVDRRWRRWREQPAWTGEIDLAMVSAAFQFAFANVRGGAALSKPCISW